MISRAYKLLLLLPLICTLGCGTYAMVSTDLRERLSLTDYDGFLRNLDRSRKGPNEMLYLMEKGWVERCRGNYGSSNESFDRAERLSDRLFARSASREVASLVTNDAIRDYRGEPYELVFTHYYRALNYWQMGLVEDALVECRKANLRLDRLPSAQGSFPSYRTDAFIHYVTGLFYEAAGEWNDAYVSYRAASAAYQAQTGRFRAGAPPDLAGDLARMADRLGYREGPPESGHQKSVRTPGGDLIIFCETGFVARKVQEEIDLPIYEGESEDRSPGNVEALCRKIAGRAPGASLAFPPAFGDLRWTRGVGPGSFSPWPDLRPPRPHGGYPRVDYWLRVALPACPDSRPESRAIRIRADGLETEAVLAEDISAIARASFEHAYPTILLRTVSRGVSKYLASRAADRKNKVLGFLANLVCSTTEAADTRSWVSLPHSVQMARLRLPAGTRPVTVEAVDAEGRVVDRQVLPQVKVREGEWTFLSWRTFK